MQRALRGRQPSSAPRTERTPLLPTALSSVPACAGSPPPALRCGPSPQAAETPARGPPLPRHRPRAAGAEAGTRAGASPALGLRAPSAPERSQPSGTDRPEAAAAAAPSGRGVSWRPGLPNIPSSHWLRAELPPPPGAPMLGRNQPIPRRQTRERADYNAQHAFRRAGT